MQKTDVTGVFSLFCQYHINKLSIMASDNHMNNSEKEVDEVDAALSDLEITLEGGKTSNTLVWRHCHIITCTGGNSLYGLLALGFSFHFVSLLHTTLHTDPGEGELTMTFIVKIKFIQLIWGNWALRYYAISVYFRIFHWVMTLNNVDPWLIVLIWTTLLFL